jgi:hypothetical protein
VDWSSSSETWTRSLETGQQLYNIYTAHGTPGQGMGGCS